SRLSGHTAPLSGAPRGLSRPALAKEIRRRRHHLMDEPRPRSSSRRRGRIKPRGYAAREQEPCRGGPLALKVHDQRRAEFVAGLEVSHNALRDEDPPGLTVRL